MSKRWVLVAGGKSFRNQRLVWRVLDETLKTALQAGHDGLVVVHADSTDTEHAAQRWAEKHLGLGVAFNRFPADWDAECVHGCKPNHRRTRHDGTTYCPAEGYNRLKRMFRHIRDNGNEAELLAFYPHPTDALMDSYRYRATAIGMTTRRLGVPANPEEKAITT